VRVDATQLLTLLEERPNEVLTVTRDRECGGYHVHSAPTRIADAVLRGKDAALETAAEFLRTNEALREEIGEMIYDDRATPAILNRIAEVLRGPVTPRMVPCGRPLCGNVTATPPYCPIHTRGAP